jgi:hypothetical protein
MFQDLDATVAALLDAELSVANVAVSFAAPDDQFPPSGVNLPAVAFFLYDVRENNDLRPNQWELERRANGMVTRKRPPVRVDCSYLITAWPSPSTPDPAQDEHRLAVTVSVDVFEPAEVGPAVTDKVITIRHGVGQE